ncbi:hypothetical protein ACFWXH_13505 [Mesorhizobium sp. NPDC059054]|uniref:hypothetical protein n=1 Tax=Mesorhizobium sp. NPDC059054 TaxID=3346711 RepID=UPI0036906EA6
MRSLLGSATSFRERQRCLDCYPAMGSQRAVAMPTVMKVALIVAVLLAMFYIGFLFSTGGPGALIIPGHTPQ